MDKKAKSSEMNVAGKVSFISGIVISLLVIVTGLCFAISCVHIYISGGNRPFTYESIGTHFKYIALPVILTIISVVCGGVLSIIYPIKEKLPTGVSLYAMLKLTYRKKNGIICAESIKQRRYRTYVRLICGSVCLLLLAIALTASLCHKYSTEDINTHIANVCLISLPLSVSGLGIIFAASFLCNSSCRKELDAILGKNESTSNEITNSSDIVDKIGAIPEKAESFYDKNEKIINNIIRVTILIISVVFIIIGIINGGMADVLGKAVRICTECIGLG